MSSLRGQTIEQYCGTGRRHARSFMIPLYPAPAHPDTGALLHLQAGAHPQLNKETYVKIQETFQIPRWAMRSMRSCPAQLRADSLKHLLKSVECRTLLQTRELLQWRKCDVGIPRMPTNHFFAGPIPNGSACALRSPATYGSARPIGVATITTAATAT